MLPVRMPGDVMRLFGEGNAELVWATKLILVT
jgi:hypothetical protein